MNRNLSSLLFGLAAVLCAVSTTQAATITWDAAQDTTSVADVSTAGTLVAAFNGGSATVTVGGETFTAANPFGFASANGFLNANTGDADFNALLNSASFSFNGNNTGNSGSIDLGSFTPGTTYEVQVFFVDQRPAQNDRINRIGSTDTGSPGATVDLESDPNNALTAPYGQFAIGTFVADGDDPDLTVLGTNFASAQINAWQVRSVVPEPTTACLLVVAAAGLACRRN